MKLPARSPLFFAAAVLAVSGCSNLTPIAPPEVPESLRPPAGQVVYLETLVSGFQVYECRAKPEQPSAYEWAARGGEGPLVDRSGRSLGKHYSKGGPVWESNDGSTVLAEVKARSPAKDPSAVPWLLLSAKSTTGTGAFGATKSIQRVQTVGGIAPREACGAANANQVTRVPYTATFYYYRDGT